MVFTRICSVPPPVLPLPPAELLPAGRLSRLRLLLRVSGPLAAPLISGDTGHISATCTGTTDANDITDIITARAVINETSSPPLTRTGTTLPSNQNWETTAKETRWHHSGRHSLDVKDTLQILGAIYFSRAIQNPSPQVLSL